MLEGAKLIGAGAATIALAVGIGSVFSSLIHSMARNPSLAKQSFAILRKGFSTGLSYMYSNLEKVSQWVDLVKKKISEFISSFGSISPDGLFYLVAGFCILVLLLHTDPAIAYASSGGGDPGSSITAAADAVPPRIINPNPGARIAGSVENTALRQVIRASFREWRYDPSTIHYFYLLDFQLLDRLIEREDFIVKLMTGFPYFFQHQDEFDVFADRIGSGTRSDLVFVQKVYKEFLREQFPNSHRV